MIYKCCFCNKEFPDDEWFPYLNENFMVCESCVINEIINNWDETITGRTEKKDYKKILKNKWIIKNDCL